MLVIMKGWFECVYVYGFVYGVGEYFDMYWGDCYGEGLLVGKCVMIVVMMGGWELYYSLCGINGLIDDLLFLI